MDMKSNVGPFTGIFIVFSLANTTLSRLPNPSKKRKKIY
jgi:hypothetical protein